MDNGVEIFRQIFCPQVEDVPDDHFGRVTLDARRRPLYVRGNTMSPKSGRLEKAAPEQAGRAGYQQFHSRSRTVLGAGDVAESKARHASKVSYSRLSRVPCVSS